jgi:integrase
MATIRKRKSAATGAIAFQAVVRRQGYPDQRKTFSTLQAAEDWAYDIERDIRDRRVDPRALAERKTVRDAVQLYLGKMRGRHKSFKDTTARCEYFSSKIGGVALSNLTAVMIDEAVEAMDCSGPTKNRYLGAFSGCLEFVRKTPYAWITVNPVKAVTRRQEHKPRSRIITAGEWKALLAAADQQAIGGSVRQQQLPTYLRLAYATGRRRGELLKLRWVDWDADEQVLWLLDTKTGDDQPIPVGDIEAALLSAHEQAFRLDRSPYIFPGTRPGGHTDFDEPIRTLLRQVCPPDRKGEVPVFHSVRHTVATELGVGGASEAQIMAVTGHHSSASVNRYVKKTVQAARAAQALRRPD